MNNIDKILGRIAADADAQISGIQAQTDQEVQDISQRAQRQADGEYSRLRDQGQAEAQALVERMDSMDALEARKQLLSQKQELVSDAFQAVLKYLCSMDDPERASFLAQLAVNGSQTGAEELVLSTHDRETIGDGVVDSANLLLSQTGRPANLTLCADTRSGQGGLYLRSGSVEANCSYETILRLAQETYASQVAGILFA